jgi:ubiquinone/menaquinone biosynthesis C-methylase UbiE
MRKTNKAFGRSNYNGIAPVYDFLAALVLGRGYIKSKWALLENIRSGDTVWFIGGGTGANLPDILERCGKNGRVIYSEASEVMLQKAKSNTSPDCIHQVKFLCSADFLLPPDVKVDVVITQFLLDVLPDASINSLFEQVGQRVSLEARWIFLDFYPVRNKQLLIRLMISFFSILTRHPRKELPEYDTFFRKWGWTEINSTRFKGGFYIAKLYDAAPMAIRFATTSLK